MAAIGGPSSDDELDLAKQAEQSKKFEQGKLSIRDWREQIQNVMNMYVVHSSAALPS